MIYFRNLNRKESNKELRIWHYNPVHYGIQCIQNLTTVGKERYPPVNITHNNSRSECCDPRCVTHEIWVR